MLENTAAAIKNRQSEETGNDYTQDEKQNTTQSQYVLDNTIRK